MPQYAEPAADRTTPTGSGVTPAPIATEADRQRPSDTPSLAPPPSSLSPPIAPSAVKHEPPARLPVSAAIAWRTRKKKGENVALEGSWLFSRIQQRDHVRDRIQNHK